MESKKPSLAVVAILALAGTTSTVALCESHHWRSLTVESAAQTLAVPDPVAADLAARRLTAVALDTIRHLQVLELRDDARGELASVLLQQIREAVK